MIVSHWNYFLILGAIHRSGCWFGPCVMGCLAWVIRLVHAPSLTTPPPMVKVVASDGKTGKTHDISYTDCKVISNSSFGIIFQAKCVLFVVLTKMWLVNPNGGLEACRWEWCGWTDCGVSAVGQVVRLYMCSSHRPSSSLVGEVVALNVSLPETIELRYPQTLNGILPPSIRVYAWSPILPTFSVRFSC
jgi:hypothetical protein